MKNINYLRNLASKLEGEFISCEPSDDLSRVHGIISVLKTTRDPLKDIYILSKVKPLELLCTYFLFILKKLNTGEINYDNLLENLDFDKAFITKELFNNFNISKLVNTSKQGIKTLEKSESDFPKPGNITPLIKKEQQDISKLDLGNSLVESLEEEFLSTDFQSSEGGRPLLELLTPEIPQTVNSAVFGVPGVSDSLPIDSDSIETISEVSEESNQSAIPEIDSDNKEAYEETVLLKKDPKKGKLLGVVEQASKIFQKGKQKASKKKDSGLKKILISTLDSDTQKESEEIKQTSKKAGKKKGKKFIEEPSVQQRELPNQGDNLTDETQITTSDETQITTSDEIPESIEHDKVFIEFETAALKANIKAEELIKNLIYELKKQSGNNESEKPQDAEIELSSGQKANLNIVINDLEDMEDYSRKLSFVVIADVYGTIKLSLKHILNTGYGFDEKTLTLFVDAIKLIHNLISGNDYTEYKDVVDEIEKRKQELIDYKLNKEKRERLKSEKETIERTLVEKYSDEAQRKILVSLKNRILDVENIFKSIEDIKEDYAVFPALRILSNTIVCFRDIVKMSNELNMPLLARLSEASYVFIKYLQNYRMNPLSEEVREILKFIIRNKKLVFIDKPSKDIEQFIALLNNPERIFFTGGQNYY